MKLLGELNDSRDPRIIITTRPQDTLPDWITHIARLDEGGFKAGRRTEMFTPPVSNSEKQNFVDTGPKNTRGALITMKDVNVKYHERHVSLFLLFIDTWFLTRSIRSLSI